MVTYDEYWGGRFKVQGSRFKVQGSRFKVQGSELFHKVLVVNISMYIRVVPLNH
jgi:hypothetical protein